MRWLHISDIHFRGKHQLDQNDAFLRIREDLATRKADGKLPDLIFVTGDITHSGQGPDFGKMADRLSELCKEIGISHKRVIFCPGNHDSDTGIAPILIQGCWTAFTDIAAFQAFLATPEYTALKARQAEYRAFVRKFHGDLGGFDSDDLHAISHVSLDELRVGVLSVNSSMLAEGGHKDHGRLQVSLRSLEEMFKKVNDCDLVFTLMHHPFDWLADFETDRVEQVVLNSSDVLLRGHLHRAKLGNAYGGSIISAAGALWEEPAGDWEYSFGSIALDTLNCDMESARFIQKTGKWMRSSETNILSRDRHEACMPSLIRSELAASLKFPAQVAAVLSGYSSELMMTLSGSPNYFSTEKVAAAGLRDGKLAHPAIGIMGTATLITFYGPREIRSILKAESAALTAYDAALLAAGAADPEFAADAASREKAAEKHANIAPNDRTWSSRLLSRLVSRGDAARILALRDDSGEDPFLANLKAALIGGVRDPYEAWRALNGPGLEYAELSELAVRLAVKGTLDLASLALIEAAKRFPSEARQLSGLARTIATELSDPSVFTQFQIAVEST